MKTKTRCHHLITARTNAFTRTELSIGLAAVVLVLLVSASGMADTRSRSQRAGCVDNLRQIGQAVQVWAADHDNKNPWLASSQQGGTKFIGKPGNAYREFGFLSNELVSPKILVCPADKTRFRNAADNWGTAVNGGYLNISRANNSTSYTIGLHSAFSAPDSLVSSDRNLQTSGTGACSVGINNASIVVLKGPAAITVWTNSIHQLSGNLLLNDGRVLETSNSGLKSYFEALGPASDGASSLHLIIP